MSLLFFRARNWLIFTKREPAVPVWYKSTVSARSILLGNSHLETSFCTFSSIGMPLHPRLRQKLDTASNLGKTRVSSFDGAVTGACPRLTCLDGLGSGEIPATVATLPPNPPIVTDVAGWDG